MLMVSSFFKWLLVPLFIIPLLSMQHIVEKPVETMHPFYLAVTEINYNRNDKVFEVTTKMFTDDFEKVLGEAYQSKVDLVNPNRFEMNKLIKDYLEKHLMMIVDDKSLELNYMGFQQEEESVYCFLEITGIEKIKKVSIKNSLLHDLNESQINIMHVIVDGKRESVKLNYPDKVANFKF